MKFLRKTTKAALYWYKKSKKNKWGTNITLGVVAFFLFTYLFAFSAPGGFPEGALVKVPEGKTVRDIAHALKDKHLIRSTAVFEALLRLEHRSVIAGEYSFQQPQDVFTISNRITSGDFNITPIRVTVFEGSTAREIATLLGERVPDFDDAAFYRAARGKEGYLFPDTYFILPGASVDSVLGMFDNAFQQHLNEPGVQTTIKNFGKPLSDVVTMASLLEREVPDTEDRRIVAGILWKRIKMGMPLQVDAVFPYILGKNSFDLTKSDLSIDSPYNTYLYKGLPAGPIANPSLDAIMAAVTPIQTNYLYYLSDKHGNIYYSATYEQHLAKKHKYLGS